MYCPRCGAPVSENQRFCPSCGFALEGNKPAQPAAPSGKAPVMTQPGMKQPYVQPQQTPEPAPKKKLNLGLLIGLIAGGVVLAAAMVVLFVLHPWSKSDDDNYEEAEESVSTPAKQNPFSWIDDSPATPDKQIPAELPVPEKTPALEPAERPQETPAPTPEPKPVKEYQIEVWVGENAVDLTKAQIEEFNRNNDIDVLFTAVVNGVSEATCADYMLYDVSAGADIFCFTQDQFARLMRSGALSRLDSQAAALVKRANDAGSVTAATSGDALYAYPMTSDNGYFMYYDKRYIPEEDVDSLEKLIADCEASGRSFAFECQTSAWYIASWFFATGCKSEWGIDDDGSFISVVDTFNSPEGLIAVKGMKKLLDSACHISSSTVGQFENGAAIVVSGTWDYEAARAILGDYLGVTDLPSFTVDGKSYHLGSFSGCKLIGVKPQEDAARTAALHKLAQYLTDETCQMERFNALSWGPSNLNAQKSDAVQADPGLAALLKQNEYSVPQCQIHGAWWDIAKVIGEDVKAAKDDAGLVAALDNYYNKLAMLFAPTEEGVWSVIGCINGTSWDTDFPMTEVAPGLFCSDLMYLGEGEEFKVRYNADWMVNYGEGGVAGGNNIAVPQSGWCYVYFEEETGLIWLEYV